MELYRCIVADDATGAFLDLFSAAYDQDAPTSSLIEDIEHSHRAVKGGLLLVKVFTLHLFLNQSRHR